MELYAYAKYWRRRNSPLAKAIKEREGRVGVNGGTPRHPRTARAQERARRPRQGFGGGGGTTLERTADRPRHRVQPPKIDAKTRRLIDAGYYDEMRRAFHEAEE